MRRSKGEGGIYKRPDRNLWTASVDVPSSTGKRRRRIVYGKTRREVADKLFALRKEAERGGLPGNRQPDRRRVPGAVARGRCAP